MVIFLFYTLYHTPYCIDVYKRQPQKVLLGWMVEVDTLERVNRQHRETLKGLQQIYTQPPSIPFLLLKGIGIADFYPHPEHRIAGDIDLWFGNEAQTEEANQRMEKLGLPVKRGANGEASCLINLSLIHIFKKKWKRRNT